MSLQEIEFFLKKKKLIYIHPRPVAVNLPLRYIAFPHGLITFGDSQKYDLLQTTDNQGLPYAAGILAYYFATDIDVFYDMEYVRDYQGLVIANQYYKTLTPAVLGVFFNEGRALLHRYPKTTTPKKTP